MELESELVHPSLLGEEGVKKVTNPTLDEGNSDKLDLVRGEGAGEPAAKQGLVGEKQVGRLAESGGAALLRRSWPTTRQAMKAWDNHNWNTWNAHPISLEQGSQEVAEVHHLLRSVIKLCKLGRLDHLPDAPILIPVLI